MDAEIFCVEGREGSVDLIKETLRTRVYSGIAVNVYTIKKDTHTRIPTQIAWKYVKLLQAAIPPEKGFQFSIHELEHFGYRFYIEVYYPIINFRRGYSENDFDLFFPAIAIRDRMVVVPLGLKKAMAGVEEALSLFKPFRTGGLLEIDLNKESEIKQAITTIGKRLHDDLIQELKAYASYQKLKDIDLSKFAQDFNVDLGFIQHSIEGVVTEAGFYNKLTCQFDRDKFPLNRWSKVVLTAENQSDIDLPNLDVNISGPIKIRPTRIRTDLPKNSTVQIPIAIMPEDAGDFPVEIVFMQSQDKLIVDCLPIHHIWLQTEP
jgi:hypothetical protein